jgi:uncharacterized membrane protein
MSSSLDTVKSTGSVEFSTVARRNGSISRGGVLLMFGSLMMIALMIGVSFALLGAWLVLPFAGVEIAVLGAALNWILRHAYDYERIRMSGGMLEVEVVDGARRMRRQFNPVWARVVLEVRGAGTHLALRSHGRELEIGRYLTADDRRGLAHALNELGLRSG